MDDRISRRTLIGGLALGAVGLPLCRAAHPATRSRHEIATRTVDFIDERWITHAHALTRQVASRITPVQHRLGVPSKQTADVTAVLGQDAFAQSLVVAAAVQRPSQRDFT